MKRPSLETRAALAAIADLVVDGHLATGRTANDEGISEAIRRVVDELEPRTDTIRGQMFDRLRRAFTKHRARLEREARRRRRVRVGRWAQHGHGGSLFAVPPALPVSTVVVSLTDHHRHRLAGRTDLQKRRDAQREAAELAARLGPHLNMVASSIVPRLLTVGSPDDLSAERERLEMHLTAALALLRSAGTKGGR